MLAQNVLVLKLYFDVSTIFKSHDQIIRQDPHMKGSVMSVDIVCGIHFQKEFNKVAHTT